MPFPFTLSTTSHLTFQSNLSSSTHPSLPSVTTSQRGLVRAALKSHKRLSPTDQSNNLPLLVSTLNSYLKHLSSLDLALCGKPVSSEDVDLALINEIEVEWRPTLSSTAVPGRESERVKGRGLDFEIYFVHHTLALVHTLLARQSLLGLYASTTPTAEQRLAFIQSATKGLKTAFTLHAYLSHRSTFASDGPPSFPASATDISPSLQTALQSLVQAELNLLAVLKDDTYPSLLVQSRNKSDREWMIKAPTIPKMRTQVLRRLCIGASNLASTANSTLSSEKRISPALLEYTEDLRKTSQAKAHRFAALDADLSGETGTGIAWLHAGMVALDMPIPSSADGSRSGLKKLKASWHERREDKRIAKADGNWGLDAGRAEEGRILEYLYAKLEKENSTVNVQLIPEWKPLLQGMPSGMVLPVEDRWVVGVLEEGELAGMRGPPDDDEGAQMGSSSGGEEDGQGAGGKGRAVGAFPGTGGDYKTSKGSSYY